MAIQIDLVYVFLLILCCVSVAGIWSLVSNNFFCVILVLFYFKAVCAYHQYSV